jgi:hypothetical protein
MSGLYHHTFGGLRAYNSFANQIWRITYPSLFFDDIIPDFNWIGSIVRLYVQEIDKWFFNPICQTWNIIPADCHVGPGPRPAGGLNRNKLPWGTKKNNEANTPYIYTYIIYIYVHISYIYIHIIYIYISYIYIHIIYIYACMYVLDLSTYICIYITCVLYTHIFN